jgi:hypothetical protein
MSSSRRQFQPEMPDSLLERIHICPPDRLFAANSVTQNVLILLAVLPPKRYAASSLQLAVVLSVFSELWKSTKVTKKLHSRIQK